MSTETLSEEITRIESRLEEIESRQETAQSESEQSDLVDPPKSEPAEPGFSARTCPLL